MISWLSSKSSFFLKQLNEDLFDIDGKENQTINAVDLKFKLNKINKLIKDLKTSNGKKNPR